MQFTNFNLGRSTKKECSTSLLACLLSSLHFIMRDLQLIVCFCFAVKSRALESFFVAWFTSFRTRKKFTLPFRNEFPLILDAKIFQFCFRFHSSIYIITQQLQFTFYVQMIHFATSTDDKFEGDSWWKSVWNDELWLHHNGKFSSSCYVVLSLGSHEFSDPPCNFFKLLNVVGSSGWRLRAVL